MNITVAQRSQVHIPWMTIVIVLMSLLAAAAVLVLVSQPAELTVGTSPAVLAAPGAAVVPKPESRAQILSLTGRPPALGARTAVPAARPRHNLVIGTTLDPVAPSSSSRTRP